MSISRPIPPLFISLFLCLWLLDCARFRVKELKPLGLFSLDIVQSSQSNPGMRIQVMESENVAYNLPIRPAIARSKLYVVDTSRRLVRIFTDDRQEAELIAASQRPTKMRQQIKFRQIELNIPGGIAVDEDAEHIYIQSYIPIDLDTRQKKILPPEKRLAGRHSRIMQSPSMILDCDEDLNLIGKIGREGYGSEPFDLVMQMHPDGGGRLNVLHKNKETSQMEMLVFRRGRLIRHFVKPELEIELESKKDHFVLEHIQAAAGKDFVLGSLAVRKKDTFDLVERIVYQQSSPQGPARILLRNDNPIDFLTWASSDGSFHMLQTDESGAEVLLKVFTNKGEYLRNRRIEFPGLRSSWRDIFFSLGGSIFTTRVFQGKFLVYEWK